jgi:ApaG protein
MANEKSEVCVSTSEAVTQGIRVHVEAQYDPTRSLPHLQRWFFLYTVRIVNEGVVTVQLISRHWIITDATGHVEEVRGPGVVGEQPVLAPGQSFVYTSGCPLSTPFGTMRGTYQMVTTDGRHFDAVIAPFTLSEPYSLN